MSHPFGVLQHVHGIVGNGTSGQRQRLTFRSVNRRDAPGYEPGLQRHHILPRQILTRACFHPLLDAVGRERLHFDDFRHNGLLLPANDSAGAPIFELELDGMSLHGGSLRHLLSVELKESMDQLDSLAVRISVPERAVEGLRFTRPGAPFVVRLGYSKAAMREVHGDILDVSHARSASG